MAGLIMPIETNILLTVLIYLAAMVVVVPLAKRFGLGVVLGYLLAVLAIGPYGLGLSKADSNIALLAELGIVLMLFTIGLELDVKRLWAMRLRVFGYGAAQMAVCGLVLAGGVYAFGFSPAAALILGLTLALSSTASGAPLATTDTSTVAVAHSTGMPSSQTSYSNESLPENPASGV